MVLADMDTRPSVSRITLAGLDALLTGSSFFEDETLIVRAMDFNVRQKIRDKHERLQNGTLKFTEFPDAPEKCSRILNYLEQSQSLFVLEGDIERSSIRIKDGRIVIEAKTLVVATVVITGAWGFVIGYPQFKKGLQELNGDISAIVEQVNESDFWTKSIRFDFPDPEVVYDQMAAVVRDEDHVAELEAILADKIRIEKRKG